MTIKGLRCAIERVSPYVPGKTVEEVRRELGLAKVIKLGSNENPYGPFPSVIEAMTRELANLNQYPDVNFKEIKELIGQLHGVPVTRVALSHGAEGMLQTMGKCFIEEGDEAIVPAATYGLYREISVLMGGKVVEAPMDGYHIDLNAVISALTPATKLIWLANPNNPTGTVFPLDDLEKLLDAVPEKTWVILDEAYAEYAQPERLPDRVRLIEEGRQLVAVRTFSKAYGLAGARLGYAIASPEMISVIDTVSEPFNANRIGIAGAVSVLTDGQDEYREALARVRADKKRLETILRESGWEVVPSNGNFVFFQTPHDAGRLAEELLYQGFIVRPCGLWGYGNHLRVSIGRTDQVDQFITALGRAIDALGGNGQVRAGCGN